MKLQSAYDLNKKISDGRKLTLMLQWQHLRAKEAKAVIAQIRQVLCTVIAEEDILFLDACTGRRKKWKGLVPWIPKRTFASKTNGFVRTQESVRQQYNRVKWRLCHECHQSLSERNICYNPLLPKTQEEAVGMVKELLGAEIQEYTLQTYPIEILFRIEQTYCANGTYRIESGISISGYAFGYALEEWIEKYKTCLQTVWKNTPLFAGYILYETEPQGVHAYYHFQPQKVNGKPVDTIALAGCEWAAFLCQELVTQLSSENVAALQKIADVSIINDGMFYQNRCDITKYGYAQKKCCADVLDVILQPGYAYIPFLNVREDKMQVIDNSAYLLKPRRDRSYWKEPPYYLGFFYKVNPDQTKMCDFYDVLEKITITEN